MAVPGAVLLKDAPSLPSGGGGQAAASSEDGHVSGSDAKDGAAEHASNDGSGRRRRRRGSFRRALSGLTDLLGGVSPRSAAAGEGPQASQMRDSSVDVSGRFVSLTAKHWTFTLDLATGLFSSLRALWPAKGGPVQGANWAGPGSALGRPLYSMYNEGDYKAMLARYSYSFPYW